MKQIIKTKNGTTYEREWNVKEYYKNLNIRIDNDTMERLREKANEQGIKYSDIVRNLIKEYIEKEV